MLQWIVPVVAAVLALLVLSLAVTLLRVRTRTDRDLEAARAEAASLREQVAEIERRLAAPAPPELPQVDRADRVDRAEYVITHLGERELEREAEVGAPRIDRALFADLVLRETVVKAASLGHGLRRALAPEVRNRIRFEMKREVRRARKQRRTDLRDARRDLAARQRSEDAA